MRDFTWSENGTLSRGRSAYLENAVGSRFDNSGNRVRRAISLGRKTEHCAKTISLICETWSVRDFATFGNHAMCAISLVRETVALAGGDFVYSENAHGARFR